MRLATMRKLFSIAAAAGGLSLVLTVVAPAQSLTKWKHGLVSAKGDAGIYFMALEKGYFKNHGLDVEFVQLRGDADVVRALLADQLNSAEFSPGPGMVANDRGANIVLIGSSMSGFPYALYARKDIKSWDELKGKTFGVSAPGSTPDLIAREMLRRKGVDPNSINIAAVGGTTARIQALAGGKIDATAAASEYLPAQEKLGIRALGLAKDIVPEWPRFMIGIRKGTLDQRRADAVKFLAGYIEGLSYAMSHRDEAIALAAKLTKKPPTDPIFAAVYDEAKQGNYVSTTSEVPVDKLKWLQDVLHKAKKLTKPADVSKLVDGSVRTDALKIVKK
jgi:ABC-type nitrate/sulfonate/bicarbonate transport system substrate-binding protein